MPGSPCHARLTHIQEQVDSGADLVRQLLGFAQKGQYECKPLNVNSIIESSLAIFARTHKQIVIERNLEEDIWHVEADQRQDGTIPDESFHQRRSGHAGGTLLLKTENVEFRARELNAQCAPGRYVKISVSDTGIGMDKETRERVFGSLQHPRHGKRRRPGMAAVYGIVKSHRGYIEVISEPGQGATFEIYLHSGIPSGLSRP